MSSRIAHDDDIVKPADSTDEFQYEAELVAVIDPGPLFSAPGEPQ